MVATDLTVHCFVSQKAADRSFLIMGLPLVVTCRRHQLLNKVKMRMIQLTQKANGYMTRNQIIILVADRSFLIMGLPATPVVQLMMMMRRMITGTKMLKTGHTSET